MTEILSETELRRQEKRFLQEALEYPRRRRTSRECAALMAYVVSRKPDSIPEEHRQTIIDILVKDGEGTIQRLLLDHMPGEFQKAQARIQRAFADHTRTAVGSC